MTEEEIVAAVSHIKVGRAPGLDGIPPEVIKWMAEKRPKEVAKVVSARNISNTVEESKTGASPEK